MISILTDINGQKAMYDEETEIFFGPLFGVGENPREFIDWLKNKDEILVDARDMHPRNISRFVDRWRTEVKEVVV